MDDADARRFGISRAGELHRLAAKSQFTLVTANHAGQDFHQRAFAGPVFADDGMQFSGRNVDRNIGQRGDAGEAFGDAVDGNDRRGHIYSDRDVQTTGKLDIVMVDTDAAFKQLVEHSRETALLNSIESLLGWDERTMLPTAAGDYRAGQMTLLAGIVHRRRTDPRLGEWLDTLVAEKLDPHSDEGATVRELKRQYDRRVKLPQALVEELARTSVLGQQAWVHARANNDFASFKPLLEKTFKLKREAAQAIGYKECAYDALLDEFEPGALTSQVTRVLAALREQLVPLVAEIGASGRKPKIEILARDYPIERQEQFARDVAAKLGFEFERGRLDITAHPFCSSMGPHDCRITTRYDRHHFPGAFFGVLHEAGHGIYDQGLRPDWYGLPPGEAISLGIHESQSRMWENLVGRSRAVLAMFLSRGTTAIFRGARHRFTG